MLGSEVFVDFEIYVLVGCFAVAGCDDDADEDETQHDNARVDGLLFPMHFGGLGEDSFGV